MTRPDLVIVSVGVMPLGCVLCAGLSVALDGVQMLEDVLGVPAEGVFGKLGSGGSE